MKQLLLAMLVLGLGAGFVSSCTPDAQAEEAEQPPTRNALRDAFACPGKHADWLDDKTVQCLKERP